MSTKKPCALTCCVLVHSKSSRVCVFALGVRLGVLLSLLEISHCCSAKVLFLNIFFEGAFMRVSTFLSLVQVGWATTTSQEQEETGWSATNVEDIEEVSTTL